MHRRQKSAEYFTKVSKRTKLRTEPSYTGSADAQRGGGFTQAGVTQRFGRATNFQIPTNVSAGIHPRLRETARYLSFFFHSVCHLISTRFLLANIAPATQANSNNKIPMAAMKQ